MINIDTSTLAASGTFYADNGVTLGSDNSVLTEMEFLYDDKTKTATINLINEVNSYNDPSTKIGLIEIVNASKIGSLKTLLKMQVDGGAPITGKNFNLYTIIKQRF